MNRSLDMIVPIVMMDRCWHHPSVKLSLFPPALSSVSVSGVPVAVLDSEYAKASRALIKDIELYCSLVSEHG